MAYYFTLRNVLLSITIVSTVSFLAGFLGKYHWLFDLFSHFRVQYFFIFLLLLIAALVGRRWWLAIVPGILTFFIIGTLLKFYWPNDSLHQPPSPYQLKIVAINLLSSNQEYDRVRQFIRSSEADVVLLQELTATWAAQLDVLQDDYPHQELLPRTDNFGVGMLSKLPLTNVEFISFSQADKPTIIGELSIADTVLRIVGTHPVPPVGSQQFLWRNEQFINLGTFVAQQSYPTVLLGDLNCSSFSPNFQHLLKESGLKDTRVGFGLQPSWPAGFMLLSTTIDHCLVSQKIRVLNRKAGPEIGSDHLPVTIVLNAFDD